MDLAWDILKWPLLACLLLPPILVYYGLHIVRRGIIFVDLALAQVATVGTCLCLMLGHEPQDYHNYVYSIAFTLIGALIFTYTRPHAHHRVPQEALIGIVYVVAAAGCILLLSRTTEGNEQLRRTLIGDVLTVGRDQIGQSFVLYVAIGLVHLIWRRPFLMLSFDHARAEAEGMSVRWWDFLFYALFGLVVTSFVQVGGVLLVFSYLIVPAVCANLLAHRLNVLLALGWIIAGVGSMAGLGISYRFDFPTGAAIVCMLGAILAVCALLAKLFPQPPAATSTGEAASQTPRT
jgi:zinc/manganese transport system permease protein